MSELSKGFQIGCGILAAVLGVPMVLCTGCIITTHVIANRPASPTAKADKPAKQPSAHFAPAKQKQRAELLGKLSAQGVFHKIENRGGGLVRVWTGPRFDSLDIQTKQSFVGVVYTYYFDGTSSSDAVILHDGRTGRQIGTMHNFGLKMR